VDGKDIRNFELSSLRHHIGIVSQDTYIFNNSIRDNIAYGLKDVSDEQVMEAARLANAHEFISALPNGYNTKVGDRGVQLSGGQRQRVSIARAILRDPEILILDEATSALDSQSEYLVQDAIERLRQNRTVIVIAHRLSTIRNADRIVVLDKGRVVESGGHQELLEKRGSYWSFHNLQAMPAV
jgi:ABC-type multidrug transport system fused ATPase/permease subunit